MDKRYVHVAPTEAQSWLAEAISEIVWIAAPDGSTQYVNRRGTEYAGLPPGTSDWDLGSLVHPEDAERIRVVWERGLRGKTPYDLECRIRRADGQHRWHTLRCLPVHGPKGEIQKWVGTATDIDTQKQLESDLRRLHRESDEALALLETLQSHSPVGFGFVDRDFRIVRINQALGAINGAPLEQQIGRTVAELVPELWPKLEVIYHQVLDTQRPIINLEVSGEVAAKPRQISHWLTNYYPVVVDENVIGIGLVVVDITERKRAEQEVVDALRYAKLLVETSPVGIITYNAATGAAVSANEAAAKIVGATAKQLEAQNFRDIESWKRTGLLSLAEQVIATNSIVQNDVHIVPTTFGKNVWASVRMVPFAYKSERHLMVLLADISERKRTEDALRESEAKFRRMIENLEDVYVETDIAGTIIEISPLIATFAGGKFSREDYLGVNAVDFYEEPKRREQLLNALREHGQVRDFELTFVDLDGSRIPCSISAKLKFDEEGHPSGVVSTMRDITARKRDELSLRAAKEQFTSVVEQSITGIYIIQHNRFAYVNARFAEIFGYALPSEIIGLDPMLLIAEMDRALVKENIRQRIEGVAQSLSYTYTGLRKDASTVDVGVHDSIASYLGDASIVGVLQDISEKKRAEEQIRRYVAQLEHAFMRTVEVAMTLGELRDPYTAGHEKRVAELAVAIGTELGFDASRLEGLRVAGYLHDVGKIMIPAEILSKPTRLTPAEYELVKGHPQAGYDVLKNVEFPWPVAQIALQHHERMDGSGYPQGLKGEAILLEARVVAVADVVEAMSSHRPYRPGLGIEKALAEIERGRGVAYDSNIVDICLKVFKGGYVIQG